MPASPNCDRADHDCRVAHWICLLLLPVVTTGPLICSVARTSAPAERWFLVRYADPIVVIGCSHGGVAALLELTRAFDPKWHTSIFITIHVGRRESSLPQLLGRDCPMPVSHARDREPIDRGHIYVAPPDRHLCIEPSYMRLSHGPRENWARPAIDPMFRSAAFTHAPSLVGILLTGYLFDGANGLETLHRCGGRTIVQDPADALSPEMPRNALRRIGPDFILPLGAIPSAIGACLAEMPSYPERVGAWHG